MYIANAGWSRGFPSLVSSPKCHLCSELFRRYWFGEGREKQAWGNHHKSFPVHISCCTGNLSAAECFPLFLNIVLRSKDKRVGRNLGDLLVPSLHFTHA